MRRTIAVSLVLTFALVVVAEVGQAQTQTPPGSQTQTPGGSQTQQPPAKPAQSPSDACKGRKRNPDGSWTSLPGASTPSAGGGQMSLKPGATVCSGVAFMGINMAKWLG